MGERCTLSAELEDTGAMLLREFPTRLPEGDPLAVVSLLYPERSHRQLAKLVSHLFDRDPDGVLNDIGFAAQLSPEAVDIVRVREKLLPARDGAWLKESP